MAATTATAEALWAYCRIGIPGEGNASTEESVKEYAQAEAGDGPGLDRRDMFLLDPDRQVWMPADRSTAATGPLEWVKADEAFLAEIAEYDLWTQADLDALADDAAQARAEPGEWYAVCVSWDGEED